MSSPPTAGRRLLRLEVQNPGSPIDRKPAWMRREFRTRPGYATVSCVVEGSSLNTVCREARCPNIFECWENREATYLIGGDTCTGRCDFCDIATGRPAPPDLDEPRRVAESVAAMGLRYATVTGVTRDDLPDEGAWLWAETVRRIRAAAPGAGVELLVPDFSGRTDLVDEVLGSAPDVFAHNLETVPRIFRRVRPGFAYETSLEVLRHAAARGAITKSNLILGMGEEIDEVVGTMEELREAGCQLLTVTQYLRPSARHHPVARWVAPWEFEQLSDIAIALGFSGVLSGPLVRSSYRAGHLYAQARAGLARPMSGG
ncbi:lipoyl synthase [Oryzobacter terrae]|uniref:lipoyl synthase n=1 Tax=Oryzobacter terrae TaxID=1620385 RepID=UPI00366A846C